MIRVWHIYFFSALSSRIVNCVDTPNWISSSGRNCAYYATGGCKSHSDSGQFTNCPLSCGSCASKWSKGGLERRKDREEGEQEGRGVDVRKARKGGGNRGREREKGIKMNE